MNVFKSFKQWISNEIKQGRKRGIERRNKQLELYSCKAFQIMEFDGELYISHEGVPVVRVSSLQTPAPKILSKSREDYLKWAKKFE